jgi:hypothetical protein
MRQSIKTLVLKSGSHASPEEGMCVMEAVAYFAKEPHSGAPKCACPVLTAYMQVLNDSLTNDERQRLKPYIKRIIGTRDGNAKKRADILAWASIVKFTPHCLELIGLNAEALALKSVKKFDWSAACSAASAACSAASAAYSAASAADSAAYSAASAADSAAYSAASAASAADSAADSAARKKVVDMALEALDEALEVK